MAHRGEDMEQDFMGLPQPVGASVGAELSSEDVSRLYCNVFHVPSNTGEAQAAMKKVAGGDDSWSCVGENIFDVLLEMEREREQKEQLYWDLQLLNVGNLNRLCQTHQSSGPDSFPTPHNQSDAESSQPGQTETGRSQMRGLEGGGDLYRRVKRLKKAARQGWARLASEGVQTMVPSPWQGGRPGVKVHAWGYVSPPDLLLLVEVKYDVVAHLLFTEMLQEHHTPSFWPTLLPWQQHKEREVLEDLAEEALVSGDMVHLAELPGAFRIYRACKDASSRNGPKSEERSWSAVSLLYELHTCRQQERDALTVLGERLDRRSMRLLCSHIRLATLRAQRENTSHAALMAARQSWETWPHINSPCRTEQAVLWLQDEEEETNEDLTSVSPQEDSVLQLLVLSQEQERKHLVKLVHGVSLEDLQEAYTAPPNEECHEQAALRKACINRLKQIHVSLQTRSEGQASSEQAEAQTLTPPQTSSDPVIWSHRQVEGCALLLLTHLLELQEAQASALLSDLMDMNMQQLQVLQAEYVRELRGQTCTNLLQLLVSDAPLTSGSVLAPPSAVNNHSSNDHMATPKPQISSDGPADTLQHNSVRVQAADGTIKQDVCSGCGAVMEELPYLEILCVSDATLDAYQSAAGEKEAQAEETGNTMKAQSYEKQGSLITLAWSKPPGGDTDCEAESASGGAGQNLDSEKVVQTRVQSSDMSITVEHTQSDGTSGESYNEEAGEQQYSPDRQLTLEEGPEAGQPDKEEALSVCDLQIPTSQDEPPPPLTDLPEMKPHSHDLTTGLSSETTDTGTDVDLIESSPPAMQPDFWDLREPDPTGAEDQKYMRNSQTRAACGLAERDPVREPTLTEREQIREPVSARERERTMRNLVDMQKKVEQRHQRDRERQLLRVQERLSIIQNKKAEKDLLGHKHMDRLKHLTQDLPQEDKQQQKTVVRERLEQLRRERSNLIQSKRDRNTAGFRELLGPVTLYRETEEATD